MVVAAEPLDPVGGNTPARSNMPRSPTSAVVAYHTAQPRQLLRPCATVAECPYTTSLPPGRSARKERSDIVPPRPSSTTSTPLPGSARTRATKSSLR